MAATLIGPDSHQTFLDAERIAVGIAAELRDRGVHPGSRVLLKAENSTGYVIVLSALVHAAASIVLVDHQDRTEETAQICAQARTVLSIVDHPEEHLGPQLTIGELLQRAAGLTASGESRVVTGGWRELPDGLVMWSTGSTGVPKGVVKSGARFWKNVERSVEHMGHRPDDVLMPLLPFSHQYGLSLVLTAWIAGCSLVVAPYRRLDRVLRMAAANAVTVIDATPPTFRSLYNIVTRRPDPVSDLRTVRMFCCGAAPLDPTLSTRYVDLTGLPLLDSYGSTEFGNVSFATLASPRATGPAIRGIGVRIVDDTGLELATGETGEILVDSPDRMEGYLAPDGTVTALERGWQRTGDLGHLDAEGNLFVAGRKLAVHRMGYTLYPEIIESKVAAGGCSVKIIPVPDERRGSSLVFFVEDELGREQAYWRERLCALLPGYEQPNRVVVLDRLPLNRNGKPDKRQLERQLAQEAVITS
jgi:long-chain acyl-CoA synthetase